MKNYIIENQKSLAQEIYLNFLDLEKNGFTLDFNGKEVNRNNGFFVSFKSPSLETTFENFNLGSINQFLAVLQCSKVINQNCFIGLWFNEDQVFLDASKWYYSKVEAVKFGVQNNQKAIWDCKNQTEIYL